MTTIDVYLELGKTKTFASAVDWLGWSRSGRDESSALQALLQSAPRYARMLRTARLGFRAPAGVSAFTVVERLQGNVTTDFGAPDLPASSDSTPVDEVELERLQAVLKACWRAFDSAATAAAGHELRKGPRGGGRDLEGVVRHVLAAEAAYLAQLGGKLEKNKADHPDAALRRSRQAILKGLAAASHGEFPARGPRGGLRWTPRYFVRRAAWHVLDHAWELEDRIV